MPSMLSRLHLLPLTLLALALAGRATAAPTLLLCSDSHPHPPLMQLDGQGTAQVLVRNAAQKVGLQVVFRTAPVVRCLAELRHNLNQGYPVAAYSAELDGLCAFPLRDNQPDPQRATALLRAFLYRRSGDKVDWDGQHLTGPQQRVLTQRSQMKVAERLRQLGIGYDNGVDEVGANFAKLLAGRGDVVIAYETDAQALLQTAPFAGKIEKLAVPFYTLPFYLCLSRQFHDADPARAQRLWDEIGRLNARSGAGPAH